MKPSPSPSPHTTPPAHPLYEDALRVLAHWRGPTPDAEAQRRRFTAFLTGNPGGTRREHAGAHLTASAMVVDATGERVLLCLHGRIRKWVQLGGHCEDGDQTVAAAALREATEESGIEGLVLSPEPIGLDVHPVRCSGGDSLHYDVRYAALAPVGAVETLSDESHALQWFAPVALPSPLADATEPLVAPAVAWARQAAHQAAHQAGHQAGRHAAQAHSQAAPHAAQAHNAP